MRKGQLAVDAYSRDDHTKLATRQAAHHRQSDRPDHRHRQAEGGVREQRQGAVAQPVRERPLLLERQQERDHGSGGRDPARATRERSSTWSKPDNTVEVRPVKVGVTEGNLASIEPGLQRGRTGGDRRPGQAAARQQGRSAAAATGRRAADRRRTDAAGHHESVPALHSSAGRHLAADGGHCCWWAWSPTGSCRSRRCRRWIIPPSRCSRSIPAPAPT